MELIDCQTKSSKGLLSPGLFNYQCIAFVFQKANLTSKKINDLPWFLQTIHGLPRNQANLQIEITNSSLTFQDTQYQYSAIEIQLKGNLRWWTLAAEMCISKRAIKL